MLEIRLLGRFEVRQEGEVLAIPSRPAQSLFAYLLLNPGISHRREKLAGILAPQSSEENARSTLRHALWRLRKALGRDPSSGRDYILADELGVGLDSSAAYSLDVTILSRDIGPTSTVDEIAASVSAYDGELLPGFYEDWVQAERGHLEAVFERKMRLLLDRLVEAGRWDDVLAWGEHWIAVGATPEAAYRALVMAHAAKGDSAQAAAAYRRCVEALRSELGVEPAAATRELYERLARGETLPGLAASAPALGLRERAAEQAVASAAPAPEEGPAPGEPPFKGLQYFDVGDAALFFGREQLTGRLVERLRQQPLLIVVAASGSGKSSLLRAGLMPALMAGAIGAGDGAEATEDSRAWCYHLVTPTSHPLRVLALSLTRDCESVTAAATLADDMARDPRSLALYLERQALPDNGRGAGYVFIAVDQFEELFTQCPGEQERTAFIANLMALAPPSPAGDAVDAGARPHASLVLTLRADFYAHCAEYPELRAALVSSQEYIGAMTRDELRRAIECPAERGGWQFEPGLVDQLLHDAGDEPGALPLVSHALLETWRRRRGPTMTLGGYSAAGGVSGAIAHTAQTTYERFSPEQQAVARNVFLRLTELGEGTQDTRRRASISEFFAHPEDRQAVESVLATLAATRLITLSAEQAEVSHEALIREWPLLREWLREDREGLRAHRRLTEAAASWADAGRDPGELYRGARLARALEWAQAGHIDLNQQERAFLDASHAAAEQEAAEKEAQRRRELEAAQDLARQQRRSATQMRRVAAILAAALVVALVLGGLAAVLQRRAREAAQLAESEQIRAQGAAQVAQDEQTLALSRELAAVASSNAAGDPQLALLLALEAANRPIQAGLELPLEAEAALHRVLQTAQRRAIVNSEAGVAVSQDATLAAAAAEDGEIRLWPAGQWTATGEPTGEPSRVLAGAPGYHTLGFNGDHRLLADGAEDGSVTVWDVETGAAVHKLAGLGGPVSRVVLSNDGKIVAGLGGDGVAKAWEAGTGNEIWSAGPAPASIVVIDLSPDGSQLATGDASGVVVVWDTATGEKRAMLARVFDRVQDIRFCSAGRLGVGTPAAISLWDAATGQPTSDLLGYSPLAVGTFACDPGSNRVAVSGATASVQLLDSSTNRELAALPDTPAAFELGFSNDGLLLFVRTPVDSLEVWESYGGGELAVLPTPHGTGAVAISPDGAYVATGIDREGGLALWDIPAAPDRPADDRPAQPLLRVWPKWHQAAISRLAFSPDGSRLATADSASKVKLADVAALTSTGAAAAAPARLPDPTYWTDYRVLDLTFSPDGTRLAAVTPNVLEPNKPLAMWDIGQPYAGSAPAEHRWDYTLELPQWIFATAYSPDGKDIAVGLRAGPAEVRDAADGTLRYTIQARDWGVRDLLYTQDGQRLIIPSMEGAYSVWQLPAPATTTGTGIEVYRVRAHESAISEIALTPDGSRLITGSTDGTVKLWDTGTGQPLLTLTQGAAPVSGLSLSADGEYLAVASDAIRIYLLPASSLIALANSRVTRALSPEERARYLHELVAAAATPAPASGARTAPERPEHLVRAFVNSFNRMDGFAVGWLFAPEFSYELDTAWGRSELPIKSRGTLIGTIYFLARGEGGRWTLKGCDAASADGTVKCHMTYMSESFRAVSFGPAHFDPIFTFEGDKLSSVVGKPPDQEWDQANADMYLSFLWGMSGGAPDLYGRLAAMDQSPPESWESEARKAAEAGGIWLELYQGYARNVLRR